jgi:Domain of unknown function (DUF4136)
MRLAAHLSLMQQLKLSALFELKRHQLFGWFPDMNTRYFAHIFIVMLASIVLSGCSGMRIVDSQVAAFSKLEALSAATSWRYEKLPSQQNLQEVQAARQNKLEAMAAQELAKFGFKPQAEKDATAAKYSVQLSARIQRLERGPFDDPWGGYGIGMPGRDHVVTGTGRVIYVPVLPYIPPPWYVREVGLIIRDTSDNRVVYETKAQHEGRWADDEAVLPAMFTAALQGFPKPPEGKRMVNIEIPR